MIKNNLSLWKDLEEKLKESERRNSELLKKYEELEKQFQKNENVHLIEKCGMQVRKLLRNKILRNSKILWTQPSYGGMITLFIFRLK